MIAGIDLSTKGVEIVRRVDGEPFAVWQHLPIEIEPHQKEPDALAARALRAVWPGDSFWDDVWLCGVEYPFTMVYASVGLKTIMGAVCALIPPRVHVIPLPANFWQPRFCGHAMPRKSLDRKPLIRSRALALGRPEEWSQDACDAYGISWVVEQVNDEGLTPQPGAQASLLAHT